MTRTVTALYESRADADAGRERLLDSDIDADNVRIRNQASSRSMDPAEQLGNENAGLWGASENASPSYEDRNLYEDDMRSEGFLLTADVDEDEFDEAIRVLEETDGVDIDELPTAWEDQQGNRSDRY